ncbi:MAG: hypothetical protein FWG10_09460 [Eubacteriaceae bacterium]|nr:hypothetical protein [Eubacteriaceae bacterium]
MDAKQLFDERRSLFDDVVHCRKPARVPTSANIFTWKIIDSDLKPKFSEALCDWDLMEKIVREHIERYNFDCYSDYGVRNNGNIIKLVAGSQYVINDEVGSINTPDICIMEENEYDEFREDLTKFLWTKGMPRKVGDWTFGHILDAYNAITPFVEYGARMSKMAVEEYGIPIRQKGVSPRHPIESVYSGYRGIKNFCQDMRRIPEKLDDLMESEKPVYIQAVKNVLALPKDRAVNDMSQAWLAHSVMSNKQFARFYWPLCEASFKLLCEGDYSCHIFCEAEFIRLADFVNDVPGGHLVLAIEMDDIFEVRKVIPGTCVAGGMKVDLLGKGTVDQCVDRAKKLIDELGATGYIMSQDKMMSFSYDAKRENMLAVQDYVLNYKL